MLIRSAILTLALSPALLGHSMGEMPGAARPAASGTVSLPQSFVESKTGFMMLGDGLAASLEQGRMRWLISSEEDGQLQRSLITIEPMGARPDARPRGEDQLPGVINHFSGSPDEWITGLGTYRAVRYARLWDGIDLLLEAKGDTLKGTYVLAPGADPGAVRMRHHGADSVTLDELGRLVVATPAGELIDDAPVAWQLSDGQRQDIPVTFALEPTEKGAVDVLFALGDYDRSAPLLIDPAVIVQAGFFGGVDKDQLGEIAVDDAGFVYLGGWTRSDETTFPVLVGPELVWQDAGSPTQGDAFVAKLDPSGETLIYAGFIGGTGLDFIQGMAVDSLGRAYVGGHTSSKLSTGFPAVVGPSLSHGGGNDGWVARISADGSSLDYCGFIGGNADDRVFDLDIDDSFRAYVVGRFKSAKSTLPLVVGPYGLTPGGASDSFVARVAPSGQSLEYCGYLGGDALDDITQVAVDSLDGAWFAGWTTSTNFPVVGTLGTTMSGTQDMVIGRVKPTGASLTSCGYVGSAGSEFPSKLAVDSVGAVYLGGVTGDTSTFPTLVGPQLVPFGPVDGVLLKLALDGQSFEWSGFTGTYYGVSPRIDDTDTLWFSAYVDDGAPIPVLNTVLGKVDPAGQSLEIVANLFPGTGVAFVDMAIVPAALTPGVTEFWFGGNTTVDETVFPVVTGPDLTANGAEDVIVLRLQVGDDPWTDLGQGKSGTYGDPQLEGLGTLGALSPFSIELSNALENTTAWLAFGFSTLNAPFFGGTLIPDISAPGFFVPFSTDGLGQLTLSSVWPAGIPAGVSIYAQYWIVDPGAAFVPVAASNGLRGVSP